MDSAIAARSYQKNQITMVCVGVIGGTTSVTAEGKSVADVGQNQRRQEPPKDVPPKQHASLAP